MKSIWKAMKWYFKYVLISWAVYGFTVELLEEQEIDEVVKNDKKYQKQHVCLWVKAFNNIKKWYNGL